jgi:hypothetical protein
MVGSDDDDEGIGVVVVDIADDATVVVGGGMAVLDVELLAKGRDDVFVGAGMVLLAIVTDGSCNWMPGKIKRETRNGRVGCT